MKKTPDKQQYLRLMLMICIFTTYISFSYAQWQQTNGPGGGTVYSLAVNDTIWYAGTLGGGIFRSTDQGMTWNAINNGIPVNTSVNAIAFKGKHVFAGTSNGLYISYDDGSSWDTLNLLIKCISGIIVNGNDILVASDSYGVYISHDYGLTWAHTNNGLTNMHVKSLVKCGTRIIAGTNQGINISDDNGTSWVSSGLETTAVMSLVVKDSTIYAGACYSGGGVYKSTDYGLTWIDLSSYLTNTNVHAIAVSGFNILAGTWDGIYISDINNAGWTQVEWSFINAMAATDLIILAGTSYYGVSRSEDGGFVWSASNNGLAGTDVNTITSNSSGIFTVYMGEVYFSGDDGESYTALSFPDDQIINTIAGSGPKLFAGTNNGIYLYEGNMWTPLNSGLGNTYVNYLFRAGKEILAGTNGGIYSLYETDTTWKNLGLNSSTVNVITADSNNIFTGTSFDGIYYTSDNGVNWNNIWFSDFYYINSLAVHGTTIYAGTYDWQGMFVSFDKGLTWASDTTLGAFDYCSFASYGPYFFAGSYEGVFVSTDNGHNWTKWVDGIVGIQILSLIINEDIAYTGSSYNGIWKRSLSDIIGIQEIDNNKCFNVFPNPSKDIFTIETNSLINSGFIVIYNIQGQLLFTRPFTGSKVTIDFGQMPSGIYILKLINSNKTELVKLIKG